MTSHTGWELLKDRAAHEIGAFQKRILQGHVADLAEYKRLAGWVDGASFVLGLPERMQKEVDEARTRNADGGS